MRTTQTGWDMKMSPTLSKHNVGHKILRTYAILSESMDENLYYCVVIQSKLPYEDQCLTCSNKEQKIIFKWIVHTAHSICVLMQKLYITFESLYVQREKQPDTVKLKWPWQDSPLRMLRKMLRQIYSSILLDSPSLTTSVAASLRICAQSNCALKCWFLCPDSDWLIKSWFNQQLGRGEREGCINSSQGAPKRPEEVI